LPVKCTVAKNLEESMMTFETLKALNLPSIKFVNALRAMSMQILELQINKITGKSISDFYFQN
jgi:hypothetical protein